MLFYTSCSSQETIEGTSEVTSKLSEEELLEKYIKEVLELKAKKTLSKQENSALEKFYSVIVNDNYIQTLDEYVRSKAFMHGIYTDITNKDNVKDKSIYKLALEDIKTSNYQKYLEKKKTQESKDKWENSPRANRLRMLVEDLDNITAKEQSYIDSKIIQIKNDEWYKTLIISDGLRHKKIEFEDQLSKDEEITEPISFATITDVPLYPGCESAVSTSEQKKCFSQKINKLVAQNFNKELGKSLGLKGVQRIYTRFTINKEGNIVNIKSRAPHPDLKEEAIRVVKLIPQVQPGKQDGKIVNIIFDLPITFKTVE